MAPADTNPNQNGEAVLKTLLISDLVDSTKLTEQLGDRRTFEVFGRHDRVARDLLAAHNGREIDKTDGFLMFFERPLDAVEYSLAYHRALADLSTEVGVQVASRVGIHLGEVYLRENPPEDVARGAKAIDVEGLAKPVTARIMSLGGARQTLLSHTAFELARRAAVGRGEAADALQWMAHGAYRFKGVDEPAMVYEVGIPDFSPLSPPPDSAKVHRVVEDETILGWRPAPDQRVPHRSNWLLERKLGEGGFGEVWLATHCKTGDQRVLKFCFDRERLKGLQREVTLFRVLKDALGNRDDIARILDWNFEQAPYFLESEYTDGGSLLDWAQEHGGIDSLPLAQRVEAAAQVADALSAAHSVGVLHKDLKPGNVLVRLDAEGQIHTRLTDFGIGMVTDRAALAASGITVLGFTETSLLDEASATGGTQLYMAPELLEGRPSTVQADLYALGVLLYQLVVGNLKQALAPGWERNVTGALLREDIATLVDGDPERRARDASDVARRLRTLEQRRAERQAEARVREEAERTQAALARSRRRQKLTAAVVAVLTVFAAAMGILSWKIKQERDRAEHEARRAEREAETARQVSDFLIGLFEVADPEKARGETITARELLDSGSERIGQELEEQPLVKSRLTQVLGRVCFQLGMYSRAERLWKETITLQKATQGSVDATVATSLMNLGTVQLRQGRIDDARNLYEEALAIKTSALGSDHEEVADVLFNLSNIHGYQGDREEEIELAERALEVYRSEPDPRPKKAARVLNSLANAYVKAGRFSEAEEALRDALSMWQAAEVENHPEIAMLQHNLALLHCQLERPERATESFLAALETREKVLGPEHPLVAVTLSRLGGLYVARGRIEQADQLLTRALEIALGVFGSDHQLTADVLTQSGEMNRVRGDLAKARQQLESALRTLENGLGKTSPEITLSVLFLARVERDSGRLNAAVDGFIRSLELAEASGGLHHPEVGVIAHDLALVYRDQGRTAEARELLERALTIKQGLLGAEHPSLAEIRAELAELP